MSIFSDSDSESVSEWSVLPDLPPAVPTAAAALSYRVNPADERDRSRATCGTNLDDRRLSLIHSSSRTADSIGAEASSSGATDPDRDQIAKVFGARIDELWGETDSEHSRILTSSDSHKASRSSSSFSSSINFLNRLTISRDQTRRKDYRREQLVALENTESSLTYEERVENFKEGLAVLEVEYSKLFVNSTKAQPFYFKADSSAPASNESASSPSDHSAPTRNKSASLSSDLLRSEDTVSIPVEKGSVSEAAGSQSPGEDSTDSSTSESGIPGPAHIMQSLSSEESLSGDKNSNDDVSSRPQSPHEDPFPVKHTASLGFKPGREGNRIAGETLREETPSSSWVVLYEVCRDLHVSQPEWIETSTGYSPGNSTLLKDLDGFLDKNSDVMFVLHKCYSTVWTAMEGIPLDEQAPLHHPDSMYITLTQPIIEALESMLEHIPSFDSMLPDLYLKTIWHPYLPLYFLYPLINKVISKLDPVLAERIETLRAFLDEYQGLEYTNARERISRGCVDRSTMPYLVHPGQVLVTRRGQDPVAFMATSWVNYNSQLDSGPVRNAHPGQQHVSTSTFDKTQELTPNEARYRDLWQVRGWSWKFNGTFEKKAANIDIFVPVTDAEVRIVDLNVHPLEFAETYIRDLLEKRGRTFWKCRLRKFVSYTADEDDTFAATSDRYMVDYRTYQRLHPESKARAGRDDIGKAAMLDDDPPKDDTIFLFPTKLIGFNFRLKKWMQLLVDRISEPEWNKKAFESLVVEDDTKLLLEALITEQIAAEKSTDIISGKGNGLLILLHGGPGTGKTFTAEGVAEMTEKPLYRVTCGDIGTKPDEVEKYLESVLHLGKIWGCVVLMDEADVFLEERSLTDLQRNALVSVFLRVLEYYDGILILTSNRVGTFDQAFKSRIQLALHYTNLKKSQRRKIWRNFITRLKELGETNTDYDDIFDNMDELCEEEMNGRQIRNSITIARQLAQFKKEVFSYKHLKNVIGVSKRFETYLNSVNHGFTDDQLAQDAGLRFHMA